MNGETDIFDMTEENKPQKPPMSKKAKKRLIYVFCVVLGIVLATLLVVIGSAIFSGASTPEEAIAEYQKASLLYDIDGMIEYSSEYNKVVLYGNRQTTDKLLKPYLEKGYDGFEAKYTEDDIKFGLVSVLRYEQGDKKFETAIEKYNQKVENGSDDISEIAIVRMTVDTGKSKTTRDYVAVKVGGRWYFAFAEV